MNCVTAISVFGAGNAAIRKVGCYGAAMGAFASLRLVLRHRAARGAALLAVCTVVFVLLQGSVGSAIGGSVAPARTANTPSASPARRRSARATSTRPGRIAQTRPARAAQAPAAVQVRLTGVSTAIPSSFFGLGIEVDEMQNWAHLGPAFDRALALMRPGSEPSLPLRVGGYSADLAYWDASTRNAPAGTYEIGSAWVRQLAGLARRDRLRVSLAVNLAVHSPSMAASFAKAVSQALAPSRLAGVAIGDEPDLYGREPWFDSEQVASTVASTPDDWTSDYSPSSYRHDYMAYADALSAAVPGLSFSGPEAAGLAPGWLQALTGLGRLTPTELTVHRYPMSCRPAGSPIYPRIHLLLSERASTGLAQQLGPAIAVAHQAGMSLIVSEINSASCAGPPGVTDSFAAALWAPDALFELLHAGVDGVYWHVRAHKINSPFQLQGSAIEPSPELYGLAMFAQMLGAQARLLSLQVTSAPGTDVKAWAVHSRRQTSVLLINKDPHATAVSVNPGATLGAAHVERLLAPAVSSTNGVTLAGRSIGTDGRWHGALRLATVRLRAGAYRIRVPGFSAALLQAPAS